MTGSSSGIINLSWDTPLYDGGSLITGYYVYYQLTGAATWTQSALISAATLTYSLSALTADS